MAHGTSNGRPPVQGEAKEEEEELIHHPEKGKAKLQGEVKKATKLKRLQKEIEISHPIKKRKLVRESATKQAQNKF